MPLSKFVKELEEKGEVLFRVDKEVYHIFESDNEDGYMVDIYEEEDKVFKGLEDFSVLEAEDGGFCTGNSEDAVYFMTPEDLEGASIYSVSKEPSRFIVYHSWGEGIDEHSIYVFDNQEEAEIMFEELLIESCLPPDSDDKVIQECLKDKCFDSDVKLYWKEA